MDNNIHEVGFGNSTLTQIEQLYQYDKGQILKITDKVEDGTEVQFSNNNSELTINKAINDSQVEIPDILLQENKKILAYLKIINSDSETTIKTVIIPVKARTKPADYIEPEQEKPFRKYLEEKLDEVKKIEDNVSEMQQAIEELKKKAEQSASDASTSEENASTSEQNASTYANSASASATAAKESETAAATSEQNARQITEQLTEDVSQLKESIVDLSDTKKEEISQKGLEVLQSIPADYSALSDVALIKPTVSGTDMVITDSSNMNIQELHLYGKTEQKTTKGKNLFDANTIFSTFIADGRATVMGEGVLINGTFGATSRNFSITLKKGTYYISGGGILHILDTGDSIFNKKIVVEDEEKTFQCYIASNTYSNKLIQPQIEIGSVATDYEPYTGGIASPNPEYPQEMNCVKNPTVKIGGSNILNFENKESFEKDGIVFSVVDGVIKVKGTATLNTSFSVARQQYLESNTYIFNPNPTKGVETINCYLDYSNDTNLGMSLASKKINQPVIVADNNSEYLFGLRVSIKQGATVDMEWKPQLLMNNIVLPYEPYKEIQSATLNYELNGIDTVRDELIVRADGTGQMINYFEKIIFNGKEDWGFRTDIPFEYNATKLLSYTAGKYKMNSINLCSHFKGTAINEENNLRIVDVDRIGFQFNLNKNQFPTIESWKNWLAENNVEVIVQLNTPQITELSAEEVKKILAIHTNMPISTIWNDQNADMQITYVADAKNYIDNKFTELSNAIIASASEAE